MLLRPELLIHLQDLLSLVKPPGELLVRVLDSHLIHGGPSGMDSRPDEDLLSLCPCSDVLGQYRSPDDSVTDSPEFLAHVLLGKPQYHAVSLVVCVGTYPVGRLVPMASDSRARAECHHSVTGAPDTLAG